MRGRSDSVVMSRRMNRQLANLVAIAGVVGLVSCERTPPARSNDTATTAPSPPRSRDSTATRFSPWDSSAGPALLVAGASPSQGNTVLPAFSADTDLSNVDLDASSLRGQRFDLLSNGSIVQTVIVGPKTSVEVPEDCSAWPTVKLSVPGDSAIHPWTVGLSAGHARPVAFDSISVLSPSDSARLTINLARVASGVPGDTVTELRGLPYQVRRAYRFTITAGVEGVVSEIVRTLNQEANPKQEHLLLVVEKDSLTSNQFVLAYSERTVGAEDVVESTELLAIVRIRQSAEPVLLIARYLGDGVVYALIERMGPRRWRLRWTSPYTGC
jgi:hypothetical protein